MLRIEKKFHNGDFEVAITDTIAIWKANNLNGTLRDIIEIFRSNSFHKIAGNDFWLIVKKPNEF